MHFIYTALLTVGLLLAAPYYLARSRRYASLIKERLGFHGPPRLRRSIWVHAVSVGEVKAVETLLERLRAAYPDRALALSTTTPTGHELALRHRAAYRVFYFPFDLPWAVRRTLDHIDPEVIVIAETEIWPNLITACQRRGVKLLMVNGRIADRSFGRYKKIRPWLAGLLNSYTVLGVQSQIDRERVEALGGSLGKIMVFGNLKYDAPDRPAALDPAFDAVLQYHQPLWIAASTAPGEEEFVLDAFAILRARHPELHLLIAPRKADRFDEVEELIRTRGHSFLRRSRLAAGSPKTEVILLDTLGELAAALAHATVVFMGGTLAPQGGHNILEAARFSKPIVFGPHMENFREMSALFLKAGGAKQIAGPSALVDAVGEMLTNQPLATELGANAKRVADEHAGATDRFIQFMRQTLSARQR